MKSPDSKQWVRKALYPGEHQPLNAIPEQTPETERDTTNEFH
jgi:hypothetical protein